MIACSFLSYYLYEFYSFIYSPVWFAAFLFRFFFCDIFFSICQFSRLVFPLFLDSKFRFSFFLFVFFPVYFYQIQFSVIFLFSYDFDFSVLFTFLFSCHLYFRIHYFDSTLVHVLSRWNIYFVTCLIFTFYSFVPSFILWYNSFFFNLLILHLHIFIFHS